ncbi:hypothetical protein FOA52_013575 [Chlamydomonas sp. UWO 241]|nr:hypothetical protein FOA52_013575 [Chlamydomonas sp. UWO 241]
MSAGATAALGQAPLDGASAAQPPPAAASGGAIGRQAIGQIDRRIAMVFTCGKCDTRSVKSFSRRSYEKGLVLVRCPSCNAHHLIADHLGWFGDRGFTVEDLAKEQGTRVSVVDASTLPGIGGLEVADIDGWSRVESLRAGLRQAGAEGGTEASRLAGGSGDGGSGGGGTGAGEGEAASVILGEAGDAAAEGGGVVEVLAEDAEAWRRARGPSRENV